MTTSEKVAYLKGLAEGMGIQEDGGQGKLFHVFIDILDDLSLDLADTKDARSRDRSSRMSIMTFWKIFLSISRTRRTRWSI